MKKELNHIIQLLESKDHLIKKLDLTDEQKTRLIDLFKKHSNLESKIDWNKRDLTWEDFSEVIGSEGKSRSQARKKGLTGLKENEDYKILEQTENSTVYYPMTHLGSKILADKVGPEGVVGQWCISENDSRWWETYTAKGTDFFFIFTDETKYAVSRTPHKRNWVGTENSIVVFNADDAELSPNEVQDLFNSPPFGNGFQDWKPVEETLPYQLDKKYPYDPALWYFTDESGNKYSKDGKKLIEFNRDQEVLNIKPGTIWIEAQNITQSNTTVQKVIIPKSVQSIGKAAFQYLWNLKTIKLPEDCFIGEYAFAYCTALTKAATSEGGWPEREIQSSTFKGCVNLEYIPLSSNVREIGPYAFVSVGKKIPELVIPETIKSISTGAFKDSGFKKIIFPSSYIECQADIFANSKVEVLDINGQRIISAGAFANCPNLKTIIGWNNYYMTSIEDLAFSGCTGLTELDLSQSGGVFLEGQAFSKCKNLKIIKLPASTGFTWNTFQGCTGLTDIYYPRPINQWHLTHKDVKFKQTFSSEKLIEVNIHCSDGEIKDTIALVSN